MALGDPYITVDDLKAWLGIPAVDTQDDDHLMAAVSAATRAIEQATGRIFSRADVASPRIYTPTTPSLVVVDDFYTDADLEVRTGTDGRTFPVVWSTADFMLEPPNWTVSGQYGWPSWRIVARPLGSRRFTPEYPASVQVTARWGWAEVPDPIRHATLLLAAELFKLRDAPFGVAGFGEYGVVRVRENPKIWALIKPYARFRYLVG